MIRIRTMALAFAVALGVAATGTTARADDPPKGDPAAAPGKPSFPMTGDAFRGRSEKRIERALARLDRMLARRQLPPGIEQQVRADAAAAAASVRAAVDEATADGNVTADEAKKVRRVAKAAVREGSAKYGKHFGHKGQKRKHPRRRGG